MADITLTAKLSATANNATVTNVTYTFTDTMTSGTTGVAHLTQTLPNTALTTAVALNLGTLNAAAQNYYVLVRNLDSTALVTMALKLDDVSGAGTRQPLIYVRPSCAAGPFLFTKQNGSNSQWGWFLYTNVANSKVEIVASTE